MNIPFKEKGIYAMKKNVALRGWIKGRFLGRFGESWSTLTRKENMLKFQVQRAAPNQTNWQISEELQKRKSCKNQGVTHTTHTMAITHTTASHPCPPDAVL